MDQLLRLAVSIAFAVVLSMTMVGCGTSTVAPETTEGEPSSSSASRNDGGATPTRAITADQELECGAHESQCCQVRLTGSIQAEFDCLGSFNEGETARMNGGKYNFSMFHLDTKTENVTNGIVFQSAPKKGRHSFKAKKDSGTFLMATSKRGIYYASSFDADFEEVGDRLATGFGYRGFRLKGSISAELTLEDNGNGQMEGKIGEKVKVTFAFDFQPE